jgi:predicted Zn-dependent protease
MFAEPEWFAARRDAEAIADERAVALVERAGYDPTALVRLYERRFAETHEPVEDNVHPRIDFMIERLHRLLGARAGGFEGRSEFLAHVDHTVAGVERSRGAKIGTAWVVARLGVAVPIAVRFEGDDGYSRISIGSHDVLTIGNGWGRELAAMLEEPHTRHTAVGDVIVGIMPRFRLRDGDLVARELDRFRDDLLRPESGAQVAILVTPRGTLAISGPESMAAMLDAMVAGLRVPTAQELAAAEPVRLTLETARRAGTVRELVETCIDPKAALAFDDPDRKLAIGDRFKCTDRVEPKPVDSID